MENSWSPFCWQHASPLVRTKVPCNLNSQIHVSQRICPWWSQPTHSAVCTERVLQNRLPTRPVQKAVQAYLTFWLWQKYLLTRWWGCKCSSAVFSQISWWCLPFSPLKEYKPGYVPFCVCQALYRRVPHFFAADFNQLVFLTAFFHKLWIPLHLNSSQGAQGPLVSLVPMKTLTSGCENVPAWCTWMTYPICWGHSWWSYSYPLVFYGIRPTQEPACRHSVISWSRLIEQYWFFF